MTRSHILLSITLLSLFLFAQTSIADTSKVGFVDTAGKIVVPLKYDSAGDFHEGLAWVMANGRYGFINKKGKLSIPAKYEMVRNFSEKLAAVKHNGKWGFVDQRGKILISGRYEDATEFSEGLAGVKLKGKWGYIDLNGKVVIEPKFDQVGRFSKDISVVCTQPAKSLDWDVTSFNILDKKGRKIFKIDKQWRRYSNLEFKGDYVMFYGNSHGSPSNCGVQIVDRKGEVVCSGSREWTGFQIEKGHVSKKVLADLGLRSVGDDRRFDGLKSDGLFLDKEVLNKLSDDSGRGVEKIRWVLKNRSGKRLLNSDPYKELVLEDRDFFYKEFFPRIKKSGPNWLVTFAYEKHGFVDAYGKLVSGWFTDVGEFREGLAKVKR